MKPFRLGQDPRNPSRGDGEEKPERFDLVGVILLTVVMSEVLEEVGGGGRHLGNGWLIEPLRFGAFGSG
jgi:hypothetical protein